VQPEHLNPNQYIRQSLMKCQKYVISRCDLTDTATWLQPPSIFSCSFKYAVWSLSFHWQQSHNINILAIQQSSRSFRASLIILSTKVPCSYF